MKIETKYNLGQKVLQIQSYPKSEEIICKPCNGVGRITTLDDSMQRCVKCKGCGYNVEYKPTAYDIIQTITIGKIITNSWPDKTQENRYMCLETGIDTGIMWRERDLWPDKEMAQAECDRRNKL